MNSYATPAIRAQPAVLETMNPYRPIDEKHGHDGPNHHHNQQCESDEGQCRHQSRCHGNRLRRFLLPALAIFLLLSSLVALSCVYDTEGWLGLGSGLARRATDSTTGGNGPFLNKKLYLIVIFVGLLVVVALAIMLSVWCCKGAFNNPLCCPCYLCACCGGLACLECIGCGLCLEGASEIAS